MSFTEDEIGSVPPRYQALLRGPEAAYWAQRLGLRASSGAPVSFRPKRGGVGFLGSTLSSVGGTERWHVSLLPRLAELGVPISGYACVAGEADGLTARVLRGAGVPVGVGDDATRELAASSRALVAWGEWQPERVLPSPRPRVVSVAHGDGPWTLAAMERAAPFADLVVRVSDAAIVAESWRERAITVPNAIDAGRLVPSADRETLRARWGWSSPTLLFLGRLSREKRVGLALEALALLPGWRLAVAGTGLLDDLYHAQAKALGVADRVEWLGPRTDVGDLLRAADVMASPSIMEGFGLSSAEALWSGLPLVACPVGFLASAPELAELVPADAAADAWAAAVLRAVADRSRVIEARAWARGALDPDRWAERWASLLRETVAGSPASPSEFPREMRGGPGTELNAILGRLDRLAAPVRDLLAIVAPSLAKALSLIETGGCGCVDRAAQMDLWGPDECKRRVGEISGWLVDAATGRGLWLPMRLARWLVRRAIRAARRRDAGR